MTTIREFKEESKLISICKTSDNFKEIPLFELSENNLINASGLDIYGIADDISEYINKDKDILSRYFHGGDIIGSMAYENTDHRLDMEYDELSESVISASHKVAYFTGHEVGSRSSIDIMLSIIGEKTIKDAFLKEIGYNESDLKEESITDIYELIEHYKIERL